MSENLNCLKTPLYDLHLQQNAKLVDFAGFLMPLQYRGIIEEHLHTRSKAGLFDVSHMGQLAIVGQSFEQLSEALETVLSADIQTLPPGQQHYSFILNEQGGIVDDCMVSRPIGQPFEIYIVVNASRKKQDLDHLNKYLSDKVEIVELNHLSLLALQGPKACEVLSTFNQKVNQLTFMNTDTFDILGSPAIITRSGYTGEDGFEISIDNNKAKEFANTLLKNNHVKWIGLGARDSLRLEAGMPLYGNELNENLSPVEAALTFALGKEQRKRGTFLGADKILKQLTKQLSIAQKRVGLSLNDRLPARRGCQIFDKDKPIGEVTSGVFSPTLNYPIAMGFVKTEYAEIGQQVSIQVRTKFVTAEIVKLPFVSNQYKR